jgi:hypothetical protein
VASAPAISSKEEDEDKKEGDLIVRPNKEYNVCTDPVNIDFSQSLLCGPSVVLDICCIGPRTVMKIIIFSFAEQLDIFSAPRSEQLL